MEYKLRSWEINDLDSLVKYANNWNIAKNLTNRYPYPYTKEDGKKFIDFARKCDTENIFAIEIQGEACGSISIHPLNDVFRKNAEIGYWLAEPYWGNGIITKAVKEIVKFGFEHYDIIRIFARSFGSNIASHRVLEKAGFVLEAKFEKTIIKNDRYEDELIYAIRKS